MADEQRPKLEVGYRLPSGLGEVYVSAEIGKLKQLVGRPTRSLFTRKPKFGENQLQSEFRWFLQSIKDDVSFRLWYALSALATKGADRKFDAKLFNLIGNATNAFASISANFDPSSVHVDLLDDLKDRVVKLSEAAQEVMAYTNTIDVFEKEFFEKANELEKMLNRIRQDFGKYFKRDEAFEAATAEAMKNR